MLKFHVPQNANNSKVRIIPRKYLDAAFCAIGVERRKADRFPLHAARGMELACIGASREFPVRISRIK